MPDKDYPLTQEEFDRIYAKVPRLTVDIIVKSNDQSIFLSRRSIDYGITASCQGVWHLPGGTLSFGETLKTAVCRIAKRELGIMVEGLSPRGYIEYPSHYLHGMDSPVGIVFEVTKYKGKIKTNKETSDSGWFAKLPKNMHADQDTFLLRRGYLTN